MGNDGNETPFVPTVPTVRNVPIVLFVPIVSIVRNVPIVLFVPAVRIVPIVPNVPFVPCRKNVPIVPFVSGPLRPCGPRLRCPVFAAPVAAGLQKTDRCPCSASAVSSAGRASASQSRKRGRPKPIGYVSLSRVRERWHRTRKRTVTERAKPPSFWTGAQGLHQGCAGAAGRVTAGCGTARRSPPRWCRGGCRDGRRRRKRFRPGRGCPPP